MMTEEIILSSTNAEYQTTNVEAEYEENFKENSTDKKVKNKLRLPTIGAGLTCLLIINLIMLSVGVSTTKDCPIKPIIPIYLVVAGAVGILTKVITGINMKRETSMLKNILYFFYAIEFIWMILGTYWVYSIYRPNYNPKYGRYCSKLSYLLAFWLLTLHYVFLLCIITVPFCINCWGKLMGKVKKCISIENKI